MLRFGRTPLGAFYRSPLGVLKRKSGTKIIFTDVACVGSNDVFPYGTTINFFSERFVRPNPISFFIGQYYNGINTSRLRLGFSLVLGPVYDLDTIFTLNLRLDNFNGGPNPTLYLSNTDDSVLYTTEAIKAAQDWELDNNNLIADNLISGINEIDLPYAALSPFFGQTISFLLGEENDFADVDVSKAFSLAFVSGNTVYPYLAVT